MIAGKAYLIEVSVVESDRLALLLGRDILESLGAMMDVNPKSPALRIGSGSAPLVNSGAGHFAIDRQQRPEPWRAIYDARACRAPRSQDDSGQDLDLASRLRQPWRRQDVPLRPLSLRHQSRAGCCQLS